MSDPEFYGPRHLFRVSLLADCLAEALPSGQVLDAGSGNGSLLVALARRGYRVAGVDLSPASVAYSRQLLRRQGLADRAEVCLADVAHLPWADDSFDGLTCGEVLEHVADDAAAVREFYRVLRPGGVCLVTVPAGRGSLGWLDTWAGHRRRYEKGQLVTLFHQAGFTGDRVQTWGFPFVRLYEHLVHQPLFRRKAEGRQTDVVLDLAVQAGHNRLLLRLALALFALDRAFTWLPWGVGWLLLARKMEAIDYAQTTPGSV